MWPGPFLSLPIAMLAAFGTRALLRRLSTSWAVGMVTVLLVGLILLEYVPIPFPQTGTSRPDWLVERADDPENYALVHLPHDLFGYDKLYMFYQIAHDRPLINGKVARTPREALILWDTIPVLRAWDEMADDSQNLLEIQDISHQLEALANLNVRYVILHKGFFHEGILTIFRDWITIEPYYEDGGMMVYRLDPKAGEDFGLEEQLTPAVGLIKVDAAPAEANHSGTIKVDARWGTTAPPGRAYDVCLVLRNDAGRRVYDYCQEILSEWSSSRWQADEVVRAHYVMPVNAAIPTGTYDLSLTLAEPETEAPIGTPVALGAVTVHSFRPTVTTHAIWHQRIALPGYDLQQTEDALDLTLYWRALQSMNVSYKIFVHLIDPESGTILAQRDVVPRNWAYPTLAWEQGEIVRDTVTLPLTDVPPGRYELWVGLYGSDADTTWRLPVRAGEALRTRQGAVRLTTIER